MNPSLSQLLTRIPLVPLCSIVRPREEVFLRPLGFEKALLCFITSISCSQVFSANTLILNQAQYFVSLTWAKTHNHIITYLENLGLENTYICIYIYIYICIVWVSICIGVYIYMYLCIFVCIYVYLIKPTYPDIHLFIYTEQHTVSIVDTTFKYTTHI